MSIKYQVLSVECWMQKQKEIHYFFFFIMKSILIRY